MSEVSQLSCSVLECRSIHPTDSSRRVHYHQFPRDPDVANKWLEACHKDGPVVYETDRVCTFHFGSHCYKKEFRISGKYGGIVLVLSPDAVPTLHLNSFPQREPTPPQEPTLSQGSSLHSTDQSDTVPLPLMNFQSDGDLIEFQSNSPNPDEENILAMTTEEYGNLLEENKFLQKQVDHLESFLAAENEGLKVTADILTEKHQALRAGQMKRDKLKQRMLSQGDQTKLMAQVFSKSQIKIMLGKQRIWWSSDDMAMALAIRKLSNPRFYTYLGKNLKIPLPGMSSINRWEFVKKSEYPNVEACEGATGEMLMVSEESQS